MPPEMLTPLVQLGAVGAVLAWFMFKAEPRLRGIEEAIDRFTRAMLILALRLNKLTETEKVEIDSLMAEVEKASEERKK